MNNTSHLVVILFLFILSHSGFAQIYKMGDKISITEHQFTTDRFLNGDLIWRSSMGELYVVERARHKEKNAKTNWIFTKIELSEDASTIIKWKSAFKIGPEYPFELDGNKLQQVDLLQIIENDKLLKRRKIASGPGGSVGPVYNLIYYLTGDVSSFAGKQLTLDQFVNDRALWRDHENRLYDITIMEKNGEFKYTLLEGLDIIKPIGKMNSLTNPTRESPSTPSEIILDGKNKITVRNPNDFDVTIALRIGNRYKDFSVTSNSISSVFVPNGKYQIYFVYSDKPKAVFLGDSFSMNDNGVEINILKEMCGNYDLKQMK